MSDPRTLPSGILNEIPKDAVAFWFFVRIDWTAGTARFSDHPGGVTVNIDGSSQAWNGTHGLHVGAIAQGEDSANIVNQITFENADLYFTNLAATGILAGTPITIWIGWFDSSDTFIDSFQLMAGEYDAAVLDQNAQIAVIPSLAAWTEDLPRPRYTASCPYIFKDADTCGYTGADPTCRHDLSDCTSKSNQANFGGDPLLPAVGQVVSWGAANRPLPGVDQLNAK